ncbi:MAG: DUF1643 domain-containing protein [Planctomycetota bacterium]
MTIPFVSAAELKQQYAVFGHFYAVQINARVRIECRSVLELIAHSRTPQLADEISQLRPDAIVIMMNPGSSQPLLPVNQLVKVAALDRLTTQLVPTRPDTTQYQVLRVMRQLGWQHVRVLNLSDLRCTKSIQFFREFQRLEADSDYDAHTVFSARRRVELASRLTTHYELPILRGWGVSEALDPLIERCERAIRGRGPCYGVLQPGTTHKFFPPLPSLQSQQRLWVEQMLQQIRGSTS